jgi:hypothetical protein
MDRQMGYALRGWRRRKDRGTGKLVDGTRERWKPNMKVLRAVIQCVKDTKRFQPRATVIEEIGAAEEARVLEEAGAGEEAGIAEEAGGVEGVGVPETRERDEVGGSL